MGTKTRRTEIQIETHEVKVIRFQGKQFSAYCEQCRETVTAFTAEQTAELLELTKADVLTMVDGQKFHLVSERRSFALICGKSLGDTNNDLMQTASQTNSK